MKNGDTDHRPQTRGWKTRTGDKPRRNEEAFRDDDRCGALYSDTLYDVEILHSNMEAKYDDDDDDDEARLLLLIAKNMEEKGI